MTDSPTSWQCALVGLPEHTAAAKPSWEEVYRDHADFLLRCARQMGVPPQFAEDVVHDVFLVVHTRLDDFDPARASLRSWLYGILRRVHSHWRRGRARDARRLNLVPSAPTRATAEEEVSREQAVQLLERFIDSLDDKKRPVFALMQIEGMSAPEVAQSLGIKLNTVYSRLRASRRAFDQFVGKEQADGPRQ